MIMIGVIMFVMGTVTAIAVGIFELLKKYKTSQYTY
jgi:hypothetical protein